MEVACLLHSLRVWQHAFAVLARRLHSIDPAEAERVMIVLHSMGLEHHMLPEATSLETNGSRGCADDTRELGRPAAKSPHQQVQEHTYSGVADFQCVSHRAAGAVSVADSGCHGGQERPAKV